MGHKLTLVLVQVGGQRRGRGGGTNELSTACHCATSTWYEKSTGWLRRSANWGPAVEGRLDTYSTRVSTLVSTFVYSYEWSADACA